LDPADMLVDKNAVRFVRFLLNGMDYGVHAADID
jgi:hypothetical protein